MTALRRCSRGAWLTAAEPARRSYRQNVCEIAFDSAREQVPELVNGKHSKTGNECARRGASDQGY